MDYRIEYTPTAIAHLDRITQADRKRIIQKIDLLAHDSVPPGSKALKGFPEFAESALATTASSMLFAEA